MPRGKAGTGAGAAGAKKPRGPKAYKLPDPFPNGEILQDFFKKQWCLGDVIGQGGFGLIYLVSEVTDSATASTAQHVVKIEPHSNGPLFCELHFYQRVARSHLVDDWAKAKKLKYLGVPKFISSGKHVWSGSDYRFMVMPRLSTDLQKLFENAGRKFSKQTVYSLGLRMLDSLEYLHENDYVHADVKAANVLLGYKNGKTDPDQVFLVDYGLAYKYRVDKVHKPYKEDPKRAHDGTVEFTSRDAHKGVAPARRGDLEIMGYCMLQWLCGYLPWENKLTDKNYVHAQKTQYMLNIPSLMKKCFPDGNIPDELQKFLVSVDHLQYDETPDYNKLRGLFRAGLSKLGQRDEWKLGLPLSGKPSAAKSPTKGTKRKSADTPGRSDSPAPKQRLKTTPAASKKKTLKAPVTSPVASPPVKVSKPRATPKTKKSTAKATGVVSPQRKGSLVNGGSKMVSPKDTKVVTPRGGKIVSPRGGKVASPRVERVSPRTGKVVSPRGGRVASPLVTGRSTPAGAQRKTVIRKRKKNVASFDASIQTSPGLAINR